MNGKTNRRRGHDYERLLAKKFRDIGFSFCKTARASSRLLDSCKVDLAFIPYNVQAKKVKASINYTEIFKEMEEALEQNFPPGSPERTNMKMIFHSRGKEAVERLVVIQEHDMFNLLKRLKELEG